MSSGGPAFRWTRTSATCRRTRASRQRSHTHNETATGVASDIVGVRRVLDATGSDALLFVDGVSSIASMDFQKQAWGIDLTVTGSQKGLMLPVGLPILGVSEKALEWARSSTMARYYFSFEEMLRTTDSGYFPYTPPTQLLLGLQASLDLLFAEGLPQVFARHHRLAEGIRRGVTSLGMSLCAALASAEGAGGRGSGHRTRGGCRRRRAVLPPGQLELVAQAA